MSTDVTTPGAVPAAAASPRRNSTLLLGLIGLCAALSLWSALAGHHLTFLFALLTLLLLAAFPVYVCLGGASLAYMLLSGDAPSMMVMHRMVNGIDSFPLIAVPFFILAGALMNVGGITDRIFDFAKSLIGWMPGGLGHVNVGSSVIFAGMSGAAVADAGGLGMIEIRAMREAGYDDDFSIGVTAASSTIGPIIPPSLPLVIYGVMASASIGKLFIAGLIPGLMMAGALMVMVAIYAKRNRYPRDAALSPRRIASTFSRAFLSLLTPVIIVAGIVMGVFTPTEAAIAAVVYALILSGLVYRSLSWQRLMRIAMETLETTAFVMLIVASASAFAWIMASNQLPELLASSLLGMTQNTVVITLLMLLVLFVVGCFMEPIAAITILVPALLPVATQIGIDPVQFGIIMVLNLMIGLLTPPVGMVLYVLARVSDTPFERCVKATAPFLVPLVIVLLLITFIPALTLWLPGVL